MKKNEKFLPLSAVSICFSGIPPNQMDIMFKQIEELGGLPLTDLKKSTKILIASKISTEKCTVFIKTIYLKKI